MASHQRPFLPNISEKLQLIIESAKLTALATEVAQHLSFPHLAILFVNKTQANLLLQYEDDF